MKQSILYLAKLINLELDEVVISKIGEKLQGLDGNKFIQFVENSLDRTELQYKNGMQKFLKLVQMFKDEIMQDRVEKAESEAYLLAKKFLHVNTALTMELSNGKNPKLEFIKANGQDYFSSFEIKQLNEIGNIAYLLDLSREGLLEDELNKKFVKLIYKNNPSNQLTHKNGKTLSLHVKKI